MTGARLRFAPSPTGLFHVGSARTALYNWLAARGGGGVFVLRIEDTDAERGREEWVGGILEALDWLGLDWDEGPYFQSQRSERYSEAAALLAGTGRAYWCECTREEIDRRAREAGRPPGYDRCCRDRGLSPGPGRVLRFATPLDGETVVDDRIRGSVKFANRDIEDFVIVRSTGAPLFLLSNVVDDMDQLISDVVRGEDHLSNTPKYQLLWEALGGPSLPRFAHLPMLVNEKRQKLSKRRDKVALESYREQGYLAEAMCNYLALLGWGPEDGEEVLSKAELVEKFSLEKVNHSPAFFDLRKLDHFNGIWLRRLAAEEFEERALPYLERQAWGNRFDRASFRRLAPLVQERVATLEEVPAMVDFLFLDRPALQDRDWAKLSGDPSTRTVLQAAAELYGTVSWDAPMLEAETRRLSERLGRPLRKTQAPIRVAVTGRAVGPPLFESLEVLGRERVLRRLGEALDMLGGPARAEEHAPPAG
ncbi:MAG: glutamate--tRNA ligase [Actinomycetota bacterium]|nr:glutamate--tRNA ligase [Actinomycetota bacterium]